MKKISITIIILGFFLMLGTAGISDMEMEQKRQIISNAQFWGQMFTSFILIAIGVIILVANEINKTTKQNKQIHIIRSKYSNKAM